MLALNCAGTLQCVQQTISKIGLSTYCLIYIVGLEWAQHLLFD